MMKRRFALACLVVTAALMSGASVGTTEPAVMIFHPPVAITSIHRDSVTSTNWSGYAAESSSQFTDVVGTWVQPAALCNGKGQQFSSFWVGLDGYATNSVEQIGSDSDCVAKGTPSYYGWFEMYPAPSVNIPPATFPVSAGDVLTARVARSGTSYTLILQSSRGWTFSTHQTGQDSNASAEWIAEAPTICGARCRQGRLADFGAMSFAGAAAAAGGADQAVSLFAGAGGPHNITMATNRGIPRARASALSSPGNGFSETWLHS